MQSSTSIHFCFSPPSPVRLSSYLFQPIGSNKSPALNRPFVPYTMSAARRRTENVTGNVFVDETCINCDLCRWMAPNTFHKDGNQSAVHSQPTTLESRLEAMRAAVTCPTGSIRTEKPDPQALEAAKSFPLPTMIDNVYFNGYSSSKTFGASSWLVVDQNCAVMFDCPRYNERLAKAIEKAAQPFGGVKFLVLSHSDDVYGHERWAERFSMARVIHIDEMNRRQGTNDCELGLRDEQFPYELAAGFQVIHVPGHTRGSIMLLHEPSASLFTGDHIWAVKGGQLSSTRAFNFYSWKKQIETVSSLTEISFLHIWPGHGRQAHFSSFEEKNKAVQDAVERMRYQ